MSVKKLCNTCNISKSLNDYYLQKSGMHGRTGSCKECRRKSQTEYQSNNRDTKREYERTRSIVFREENKIKNRLWREQNPDYFKDYYEQNRERRLEANRRYRKNKKEKDHEKQIVT